jgi:hypothetical protein
MTASRSLRPLTLAFLGLLPLGCVDGPFARVNPHDPGTAITVQVLGGADTIRVVGEVVLFQAVTAPATSGYTVIWSSSSPGRLRSQGSGRFVTLDIPVSPVSVQVSAQLGPHIGTRTVVLAPAP